jgi:hypothetical protein
MPTSVRRSVAAFWSGSLLGFAAWGWLAARLASRALGEGVPGEEAETAVALGITAAIVLGAPAAFLFGAAMVRARDAGSWRAALGTGGALGVAVALPLRAAATALPGDPGVAGAPALLVVAPAAAMMAGAVAGALALRRRGAAPVTASEAQPVERRARCG